MLVEFLLLNLITAIHALPLALHQLVVLDSCVNSVIRLKGYDTSSPKLSYSILSNPSSGSLYQLSQVYSNYGRSPVSGSQILPDPNVTVTGSKNRLNYVRPCPDAVSNHMWGSFTFAASNTEVSPTLISYAGTVTLVPPSGALTGSNFLLDAEGWTITGNTADMRTQLATYEPYSRSGTSVNRYVISTDDKINIDDNSAASPSDRSLWYFEAPLDKFAGNYGIAYGGNLQFTLLGFAGDFSQLNDPTTTNLVEIESASTGIKLVIRLSSLLASSSKFIVGGTGAAGAAGMLGSGQPLTVSIPLLEFIPTVGVRGGWLKDSHNSLISEWSAPTQCDMIQVLSSISSLRILGDFTSWYETIALDNVLLLNTKGMLPICAQNRPDASVCTC